VFGIVDADEARLLQPLSRALQARGSLVATEHGGLMFGGDARAILKGEATVEIVQPPETKKARRRPRDAQPGRRSAVRGAARAAPRARRRGASAALRHLPRRGAAREWRLRGLPRWRSLAAISGIGARKLEAYGDAFLA
jgi:ATP-dependent DNA helicase RecQ